jgi:hypothetical protein
MLVLGRIDFIESKKYFHAEALIGVWLILTSVFSSVNNQIPQFLTWVGISAGTGFKSTVIDFLWIGQQSILFTFGALVLGISFPIWAIWPGRLLMNAIFV